MTECATETVLTMPFLLEARFLRAWEQVRLALPHSQVPSMLFYCNCNLAGSMGSMCLWLA